jgi:uncharacterized membrane protein YhaH (DUF805 family)
MNWYLAVLKKYAVFSGRARRKEYWMYVLFYVIFAVAAIIVDNVLGLASPETGYGPLYGILVLGHIIPSLAAGVRRMHDVGKSGWFLLIPIYSFVLACTDGDKGANEYGPDPKDPSSTEGSGSALDSNI